MDSNARVTPVPPVGMAPSGVVSGGDHSQSRVVQQAEQAARYRLVIEEGPDGGSFVYKTLDRVTGEVIRQLPREDVVQLSRSSDYAKGAVIDTSV